MLPKNKTIKLQKSSSLNSAVLKKVLETKFKTTFSTKPNFSSENLSQIAEDTFKNTLQGRFTGLKPDNRPLYFLSDKEIELYARLVGTKGEKRKQDKKIQSLFNKFLKKNQDLEQNVVRALGQLS